MGLEMQIDSWLVMLGVLKWDVTCCSFNAEQEYKRGLFPVVPSGERATWSSSSPNVKKV